MITRETHPVGTRLLTCRTTGGPFEVLILEWSPSGKYARLRVIRDGKITEGWEDEPTLLAAEVLEVLEILDGV